MTEQNLTQRTGNSTCNTTHNYRMSSTTYLIIPVLQGPEMTSPQVYDDTYLNMYIDIPREVDRYEFSLVTRILRENDELPILKASDNLILDTHMCKSE